MIIWVCVNAYIRIGSRLFYLALGGVVSCMCMHLWFCLRFSLAGLDSQD